ncbi:T9SS type A sorting domain-containing protein [Psychroserpens sp. NJDZ02]|uniref:T9SS type A sorting domain-containing protein n=1 Tax=Psychroserpens sp. NJDZ02 TaxID=2570561 RepID=UPI0010A8BB1F|nr:T9SS type A sorting domain-containing protein [Psychroserpens sp. NJDZ02]QCE40395.1 T9SS type A sorting domain-containing protein [Psychroserpens sp. NJDZ02]
MFKSTLLSIALVSLLFLTPDYLFAQTGPGGVGNSSTNGLWLKVDDLNLADGAPVSNWQDASGNSNDANQILNSEEPTFQSTSSFNSYPSLSFDGTNDWLKVDDSDILDGASAISFFTVVQPKGLNGSGDTVQAMVSKRDDYNTNGLTYSYTFFFYNNRLSNDIVTGNNRYDIGGSFSNNQNYILGFDFDGTLPSSARSSMFRNGSVLRTGAESSTGLNNSPAPLTIGILDVGDGRYAKSEMAEIIHYNYKLNQAETIIVNNYLSAKYDISLVANDFYIQDNTANGNFDFDVAGIGQAIDGSNHTDSQGTGMVRINTPSALSDGDFLFWGEERRTPASAFVTNNSNFSEQLDSKWRVSKTGDLGTVTVAFDMSTLSVGSICSNMQLVVDNDSNFSSATSYNLTVSGTTATATGVSFSDGDYFTLRYTDQIVWSGSAFFNGSGGSNAPDTTDSCLKLTVKAGSTAVLIADAHVREVEVEPGATLQVNNGVLLEVDNGIFNEGVIDLLGEAQLIQNHTGTSFNTGSGDLKIRQEGTYNLYNYNYWSAPVNRNGDWQISFLETETGPVGFTSAYDADPSASPIELSSYWLYTFNDLIDNYYGWNHITPTTAIAPSMGYLMKGSGDTTPTPTTDQTYVFKGTANDGDYSVSTVSGNQVLIGNPYPSAITATAFINDNLSVIEGSIYLYEHFQENNTHILADYQGGYATRNLLTGVEAPSLPSTGNASSKGAPKEAVAVAQGFFVKIENTGTIRFRNSQRVFARESASESTFYRSAQATPVDDRIIFWLKFKDQLDNESTIALGYDTNASVGFDKGYDSESFNELPNEVYWPIIDKKMSIQGLHSFDVSDEIPLGIAISESGDFTFDIDRTLNFPTNETIYLKDNQTNIFYDIQSNPVTLTLSEGEDESRFSIVYKTSESLSTSDFDTETSGVYYNVNKDALVFKALENINNIEAIAIYNMLGQKVKVLEDVDSREVNLSFLNTGIYIAEINQDSGQKITLKFIKP